LAGGLAALVAGTLAAAGVLTMTLGDVLAAHGHAALASHLPGNAGVAAILLPSRFAQVEAADDKPERPDNVIAMTALRNAPLTSEALTWLAIEARQRGEAARGARLLELAGHTGWRDEATRRQLYNAALVAGDATSAVHHADILLRQNKARHELFTQFDRGMAVPRFRMALVARLATAPAWSGDYLATHGVALGDASLSAALDARAAATGGLERRIAAPLLARLLVARRLRAASTAWRLVRDADGLTPGPLPWPARDGRATHDVTPFDWHVAPAYRLADGDGSALHAAMQPDAPPATRLLALPAGQYRLVVHGDSGDWLWSISCADENRWPAQAFTPTALFEVERACPVQRLSVIARTGAPAGQSRLGMLAIAAVQPRSP